MTSEMIVDLNVRELIDWMLRELESNETGIKDIQETSSTTRTSKKQSEKSSSKMTKKTTTKTTTTTDTATAKTTTTTHKDETEAQSSSSGDVSNRRVSLRVRNTNVQQQEQASVPANKRKLSDVLGQLAGAGGEKKQRRNTTKSSDVTDENSSATSSNKRTLPAKRKIVEVEDKENVPPGQSAHKAARAGAAKPTTKPHPQKESPLEKLLEEASDTETTTTTTTTTVTNTKTDIEVATFMAQCAALRKLNQCVSLNGGHIVVNQTATEASTVVGDNLNQIIASSTEQQQQQQQQQPLLPEFQTVVEGASNVMLSDETVEQIFKSALLENTTITNNNNKNNNNQIGINYLASDTPFFYGHEYEVYTDGAGANVCQLVEQKVTSVSERSEAAISYTIGGGELSSSASVEAKTSTNVAEEDEAKPSSSDRHEEESVTNESNEGSQSEGYNLKLPENYTPESFDFNGIDLVAIEGKNLCTYAANVAKAIFTLDELCNGYIQEGLKTRKSTKKQHLDHFRVKILKDAICNRFNITEDRLDSLWKKIRLSLNLRFARIGPSLEKKSQKSE